ncbi:MAG: hypothetical protein KAI33_07055, partial [Elusimicrobiales bacterium]|nr:hypothetical protein [Elusimicrobiales bacterium]
STINIPLEDNKWYSSNAGYELGEITGTSIELPVSGPGSGGSVSLMRVQIRRGNDENRCWNGSTAFNYLCNLDSSWINMTYVSGSTWTYSVGDLWSNVEDGIGYRIRFKASDSALDASDADKPNVENDFEVGRNDKVFKVDDTPPGSSINDPNTYNIYAFADVSGTALDAHTPIEKVEIAYFSVTDNKWWNPAAEEFNLDDGATPPPDLAFVPASTDTASPVNWIVTGSSVPTLTNDQKYRIFTRATDSVGNKTAFPGHAGFTTPPNQSEFIEINKTGFQPDSTIAEPISGTYYNNLGAISGTLVFSNTVQIRIMDTTSDPDKVWLGNGNVWESTVTYIAGCSDDTYVIGESTCGFFGVSSIVSSNWSKNISGIWPAGTNKFTAQSRAAVDETADVETPPEQKIFYIDDDLPASSLIEPNAEFEK